MFFNITMRTLLSILGLFVSILLMQNIQASMPSLQTIDEHTPVYHKSSGVSGNLSSVGSDTLANLMTLWAEEYKRLYPNVNTPNSSGGFIDSTTSINGGTSNLGPMSRKMKSKEMAAFEDKYAYKPMAIPVAIDALAVYVNRDNPVKGLTLAQVDAIFSSTRKCAGGSRFRKWGDVGLKGSWSAKSIQPYGRKLCLRYLWLF